MAGIKLSKTTSYRGLYWIASFLWSVSPTILLGMNQEIEENIPSSSAPSTFCFEELAASPDLSNPIIALAIANCFATGTHGVTQSHENACVWYKIAADNGAGAEAMYRYGLYMSHFIHTSVPGDSKIAAQYFYLAMKEGHIPATYFLARCYLEKSGVVRDDKKAFTYLTIAADANYEPAIVDLGYCYLEGIGTDLDPHKAIELFKKATPSKNPAAFKGLSDCYRQGKGVELDLIKAHFYETKSIEYQDHNPFAS